MFNKFKKAKIVVQNLVAVLVFLATSCGLSATAYKGDDAVQIFTEAKPMCPVREIGEITWGKGGRSNIAEMSAELRALVREMGGDALMIDGDMIGLGAASAFLINVREFRAVVVEFKQRDCRG